MSGNLQASVSSRETVISASSRAHSTSDVKTKCCKLFLNCFKIIQKKKPSEEIVNNNVKEYDYVVEKLVVKRVPFIIFSTSEDALKDQINLKDKSNFNEDIPQSLTKLNTMYTTTSETQSLLYYSDKFDQNIPLNSPQKCLHFNKNTAALNKKSERHTLSNDYHNRITELMNAISSLHPDLKEDERPPKDPCPLSITKNKSVSSTKMLPKGIWNKNSDSQKQRIYKSQISITDKQELSFGKKELENVGTSDMKLKNSQMICNLNEVKYMNVDNFQDDSTAKFKESIVQSAQEISYNSTNDTKSIINLNQINIKDYNQINSNLQYNHKDMVNKCKTLSENITNTDSSSAILRWNIKVKYHKPKKNSEISKKMSKYFTIN